ncbi:MAG TPA: MFS transporter, partial [Bacteroidota bacterium]|nr:MFS transporter [Bacteroidota bacterium]
GTVVTTISLILLGIEPHNLELFGFSIGNMGIMLTIMAIAGLGVGASAPASNNACIELMPDRVATITGVRGMFRQSGGAISMTIATIVLHQFTNIGTGFKAIFIALAILTMLSIPVIFVMPSSSSPKRVSSKIDLNEACEVKSNY